MPELLYLPYSAHTFVSLCLCTVCVNINISLDSLSLQAMRQAAMREEYDKERDEIISRLSETNRARNVIIAILAIIVIITVIIDMIAGYVMESSDDFSKPVIEILFKELTVLGCIALLVYMSVKTGIPEEISVQVSSQTFLSLRVLGIWP